MDSEEVTQEKEAIREKMEDTKNSMANKLEILEQKVVGNVEEVSDAVSETVQAVKDTVDSVKEQVEGTAEAVKDVVQEGVQSVRHWFDITQHVQSHPWVVMGASVGAGFLMQTLFFSGRSSARPAAAETPSPQPAVTNGHSASHHGKRRKDHRKSWFDELTPAFSQIRGLAMGALFGSIRKLVTQSVSPQVGTVVGDIIDKVAAKLGGDADSHKDEPWSPATTKGKRDDQYTDPNPTEMGRPMGSARWQG
jgi:ElaB/YqjD/DUF883 family membrane-anchored ribosome-binding protein